jgi:Phytanoyl-CoA dioxygenase (PhyH)
MPRILGRRRSATDAGPISPAPEAFQLTPQHVVFFDTFGFLVLRGLFRDDMTRISDGFEAVFARDAAQPLDPENPFHRTDDPRYERETRWIIPGFIDRSPDLVWLRDDPRITAIAQALVGDGYGYAESDGNLFNCNVYWHVDAYGATSDARHIKVFFYLDALQRDAGALRVVPGSHLRGQYTGALYRLMKDPPKMPQMLGIAPDEVPSWTLEIEPGDVIVTDFRTFHASFNGSVRRRLFTVNFRARTEADGA